MTGCSHMADWVSEPMSGDIIIPEYRCARCGFVVLHRVRVGRGDPQPDDGEVES